jgi:hypothetical protein
MKFDGGSARKAGDGNGGAVTTGSGTGTKDDPQIRTTTTWDRDNNVRESHTTVTVDGKSYTS